MTADGGRDGSDKETAMNSGHHNRSDLFSSTGEPRPADVPITVLTALILLIVLFIVAML
jgi:hypothetical protein